MATLVGTEIGRHQVHKQIAKSSLATVYYVFDTSLDKWAVLKLAHGEQLDLTRRIQMYERFEFASKVQSNLIHANIAPIYDYGHYQGAPFLVMEFAAKGTVKERLGTPHPHAAVARVLAPAAQGLMYAHQNSVVHGNVKPSNILLTADGRSLVSDFGVSGTDLETDMLEYLAPELWEGAPTSLSDIYALGVIFYELVTGRRAYNPPLTGNTPARPNPQPLPDPREFIPNLPENVHRIIAKATSLNPYLRYNNINELATELKNLSQSDSPTQRPPADVPTPVRRDPAPEETAGRVGTPPRDASPAAPTPAGQIAARPQGGAARPVIRPAQEAPRPAPAIPVAPSPKPSLFERIKSGLGQKSSTDEGLLPAMHINEVDFTLTAPKILTPGRACTLGVWAQLPPQYGDRESSLQRGERAPKNQAIAAPAGPSRALQITLDLPGFKVQPKVSTLSWQGRIGKASFQVEAPRKLGANRYGGWVTIHLNSLMVARLDFSLQVGASSVPQTVKLPVQAFYPRSAFASYASQDQLKVLKRVEGIQGIHPHLEVFLDVVSLRSGEDWADWIKQEILKRDVFYLFWSKEAKKSEWVNTEWRIALASGKTISPVPLAPPNQLPSPPPELAGLNFKDLYLDSSDLIIHTPADQDSFPTE